MREAVANSIWWLSCLPQAARFEKATHCVEKTQRDLLARVLERNGSTLFGRRHDFRSIKNAEEFQQRVPMMTESVLKSFVDYMGDGRPDILFPGLPICLEPTSGSTGEGKLIPFTAALRSEFQAGIAPWVGDFFRQFPRALNGSAYWSISPVGNKPRQTRGGLRIGFESDAEYMSPGLQTLLRSIMAVPDAVAEIGNMDAFRYVTLAFLLKARNLALISIWNPTFLTLLLKSIEGWYVRLTNDIRRGEIVATAPIEPELLDRLNRQFGKANPDRADELDALFAMRSGHFTDCFELLWPHLQAISCWANASAKGPAELLKTLFPRVPILSKGLIATEGLVTIPFVNSLAPALAIRSHIFEFLPEGSEGRPQLAWTLDRGQRYSILLTTGGGLYRYQLNDIVEVVDFHHECPLLNFIGRKNNVSDRFGEKLHEFHVAEVISSVLLRGGGKPVFTLLAPSSCKTDTRYVLFLSGSMRPSVEKMEGWRRLIESGLRGNVHYDYCRRLGQLAELGLFWIEAGNQVAFQRYFDRKLSQGKKIGSIKPVMLETEDGWEETFTSHGGSADAPIEQMVGV